MSRDLAGRTALVTGVTSGIGRATAQQLLAGGAAVVGCARDRERLHTVARDLPGLVPVVADVRDGDQREALVDAARRELTGSDILVNNAGVGHVGAVADMTREDVERVLETNAVAVVDLTRLVLPDMLRRRDGDMVMVSSSAIWATLPPLTVHAASKHAVDGFTTGLRREVRRHGVRVCSVNPGFVATEFLARADGGHPAEGDVPTSPGSAAEKVARRVVRELTSHRGRTVAVPRAMGLGRVLVLPGLSRVVDVGVGALAERLEGVGRTMVRTHATGRRRRR